MDEPQKQPNWENEIVKVSEWIVVMALTLIPLVNILLHSFIAIRKKEKKSLQNFSIVMVFLLIIAYSLTIIRLIVN